MRPKGLLAMIVNLSRFALNSITGDTMSDPKTQNHAVLLLHGLSGSPAELSSVRKRLVADGFYVEAPLLLGHGTYPDDLRNYRWTHWIDQVESVFADLEKRFERVSICGLCMGATLSLLLSIRVGKRAHSVIPISTSLIFDGWDLPFINRALPVLRYVPLWHRNYYVHEGSPYGVKDERLRRAIAKHFHDDGKATHYTKTPAHGCFQSYDLGRQVKPKLNTIEAHVFAVHPIEDEVATTRNVDLIEKHIPKGRFSKYLVEDSYHLVTLDRHRHTVAAKISEFLKSFPNATAN